MRRWLEAGTLMAALGSAFVFYLIDYDARRIAADVQAKERQSERAEADIAVLKAERAYLARPERIEPAARARGMQPPGIGSHVRLPEAGPKP